MAPLAVRQTDAQPLLRFVLLAFGISWALWVPAALASHGVIPAVLPATASSLLGAFGPSIAALILTWNAEGGPGLRGLLRRLGIWRVGIGWYGVALLWPAGVSLLTTAIAMLLGSAAPAFSQPPILALAPLPADVMAATPVLALLPALFFQQTLLGSSMGEELGWRGYALPRLQLRHSAFRASLELGLVWAMWHLPLWLAKGHPIQGAALGWAGLNLLATSVVFAWLLNNTRGSLLLALLLHSSIALTGLFLASATGGYLIEAAVRWGLVAFLLWRYGPRTLTRREAEALNV